MIRLVLENLRQDAAAAALKSGTVRESGAHGRSLVSHDLPVYAPHGKASFFHGNTAARRSRYLWVDVDAYFGLRIGPAGRVQAVVPDDEDAERYPYLRRGDRNAIDFLIEGEDHPVDRSGKLGRTEIALRHESCLTAKDRVALLEDDAIHKNDDSMSRTKLGIKMPVRQQGR